MRMRLKDDAERCCDVVVEALPKFGLAHYNLSQRARRAGPLRGGGRACAARHRALCRGAAVSIALLASRLSAQPRSRGRDGRGPEMARGQARRPGGRASSQGDRRHRDAARAPPTAIIESLFDRFSDRASIPSSPPRIPGAGTGRLACSMNLAGQGSGPCASLDLGCGTGLCAVHARDFAAASLRCRPVGRHARGAPRAPASTTSSSRPSSRPFWARSTSPYDIALSADTLCYFGALETFAAGAANAVVARRPAHLHRRGAARGRRQALQAARSAAATSMRRAYVASALEAAGFEVVRISRRSCAWSIGEPVAGHLVVARRR